MTSMGTPLGRSRVTALLLTLLCLVGASCTSPPAVPAEQVVDVHPGTTTSAAVTDRWSMVLPPGAAGSAHATLVISPPPDPSAGPADGEVLASADFVLSTGPSRTSVTFTYELDEPLPDGELLYVLDDDSTAADFSTESDGSRQLSSTQVHLAQLSPDRRTATVSDIQHLSVKSWIRESIESLTSKLGEVFGQRFDPPRCEGPRPGWLTDVEFVADPNAPMLTCVSSDPANADLAVVKVVNNRGTGLVVTAPVNPSWVYQTIIGPEVSTWGPDLLSFALNQIGVPLDLKQRTYVLPPGQAVHLGFTEQALRQTVSPAQITATVTPEAAAFGVVAQLVAEAVDDPTALTAYELGLLAVCGQGVAAEAAALDPAATLDAIGEMATCALQQSGTIVDVLIDVLPEAVWQQVGTNVVKAARVAKRVLSPYALVAQATFIAVDFGTTFAFDPSVLTISLFPGGQATRSPAHGGEAAPSSSQPRYGIGSEFVASCINAWPTAPTYTQASIILTMRCPTTGSDYLFVQVTYPDSNFPITPSTGYVEVHGYVTDVARSGYGYRTLVVTADRMTLL